MYRKNTVQCPALVTLYKCSDFFCQLSEMWSMSQWSQVSWAVPWRCSRSLLKCCCRCHCLRHFVAQVMSPHNSDHKGNKSIRVRYGNVFQQWHSVIDKVTCWTCSWKLSKYKKTLKGGHWQVMRSRQIEFEIAQRGNFSTVFSPKSLERLRKSILKQIVQNIPNVYVLT